MDGHWKAYFELNGKSVEDTTAFLLELSKGASRYAWYYHPNGRKGKGPHIHGWLYDWPKTAETLRNAGKAFFGLTQKHQFGISNKYDKGKVMSDDSYLKYIQYMTKGKFEPLCYNGIDKEILDARKQIANETYPESADNANEDNVVVRTKVDRKTEYDYQVEAEELLWNEETGHDNVSKDDILDAVIRVLHKHKRLAHYRRVANICQAITLRIHPVDVQRGHGRRKVLKMF